MRLLDKLERRFGFIAIPKLGRILVGLTALVFVLTRLIPGFADTLALNPAAIRHGEVWRLLTFIFIPQTTSPLWVVFALWFLWWVTEGLERALGAFGFTLYALLGAIGTAIAAFFFGSAFSNAMLLASFFYAFARFYPDEMIYVFFILPMKVKWIAWISAALLLAGFLLNPMSYRMALVAAFANYFIFFGGELISAARHRREVTTRRRRFETPASETETLHRCAVCGATELTNPNLEFRVARDGEEYCLPHLPQIANPAR